MAVINKLRSNPRWDILDYPGRINSRGAGANTREILLRIAIKNIDRWLADPNRS